jgi:MoxR-like ATPase
MQREFRVGEVGCAVKDGEQRQAEQCAANAIHGPTLTITPRAFSAPSGTSQRSLSSMRSADEAFLLELLSDFQVTIPEIGTRKAAEPPIVVITANRTREIHDALKRRCLYHWVDYPDAARELAIVKAKAPGAGERLSQEVVAFVQALRGEDLFKLPGVAETLDWATALSTLDKMTLDPATVNDTLGVLLKYQDDIAKIEGSEAKRLLDQVRAELATAH